MSEYETVYARVMLRDMARVYGDEVKLDDNAMEKIYIYDELTKSKVPMKKYFENTEILKVFRKENKLIVVVHYTTYHCHHHIEIIEFSEIKYIDLDEEQ